MSFELTILGSNSATPAYGRHPSAQILQHYNIQFLIDCGEGTQFQLSKYHIKRKNIDHIFISHLHGDHYYGLVGLLNTFQLNGRQKPLHIYAFPKLLEILKIQIDFERGEGFELVFHPLGYGEFVKILDTDLLEIFTFPLLHGIDCNGFLFREKEKPRKIKGDLIEKYQIPYTEIAAIKNGRNYKLEDGTIISNEDLTTEAPSPKSYAYCSDTIYTETIVPYIKEVDVLYHETTFLHDSVEKAHARNHTTSKEAGRMAVKANVHKLLIGHFSARYKDLTPFLDEANAVFENTALAKEGEKFIF